MNSNQRNKILQNNQMLRDEYIYISSIKSTKYEGIKDFFQFVKSRKSICINLNLESLNAVLLSKTYLNIFQLGYDTNSIKARYNSLSPYYDKLVEFVNLFDPDKSIKYASLRTGGLGSNFPGFGSGQISIVLNQEFTSRFASELYCLSRFSLNYIREDGTFKDKAYFKDSSTWNFIEYLAVIKHKDEYKDRINNWDYMVSNSRGWLEILIYQQILINDFDKIVFDNDFLNYLKNLRTKENLSKYEEMLNFNFTSVMHLVRKSGLKLDPIKNV